MMMEPFEIEKEEEEISEQAWLKMVFMGGAFDFWKDSSEDIYTEEDGVKYVSLKVNSD